MAIRDEIITTLVEGLAAVQRRVNEVEALKATAGPRGERGERGPPPTEEEVRDAATKWLSANITQPKDGLDGRDGADGERGERGPPPTEEEIRLAVETWLEINRESLRGADGVNGADGRDGVAGERGADGDRGPRGPAGDRGADGVGIALVEQRDEKSFVITLTDEREFTIDLPEPLKGGGGFASIYDIDAYFNSVAFNLDPVEKTGAGVVQWNPDFQTLTLGINDGSITHHVGMELYFRVKADSAITAGQVVMFTGAVGASGILRGAPAQNVVLPEVIMGIAAQDINQNDFGFVQWFGEVKKLQTDGSQYGEVWNDGDILWYDPTVTGGLTKTRPASPSVHITMAAVVRASGGNSGILFVRPTIRPALESLSDVAIETPSDGQVLGYDATAGVWRNQSAGGSGTVSSVDASGGETGLSFTGGPITSSGALTLGGTLQVPSGGTGATSLTGYVKGIGADALTASAGIPSEDISTPIDCGTFN